MGMAEKLTNLWTAWEIRVLVLVSLSLQAILIAFGSKRKCTRSRWINFLVWSAYLLADSVATLALGILARSLGDKVPNQDHALACQKQKKDCTPQSFWAPFLLLHLGGPDTITAFSLEDNRLWLRHFVFLIIEVGVATSVLLRSWVCGDTTLSSIAIPVFIAGIIKYGERSYVLMYSSTMRLRNYLFSDNFTALAKDDDIENSVTCPFDGTFLLRVDFFFKRLKLLFADYILDRNQGYRCNSVIRCLEPKEAFQLVEFELGLLYDSLYTKATLVHSCFGIFLRSITCLSSVSALVTFAVIIGVRGHSAVDISITYLLLVGSVGVEVYALVMLTSSDWTKLQLVKRKRSLKIYSFLTRVTKNKRWSRSIAKYNLMNFCFEKKETVWIKVQQLLGIHEILEKHQNVEWHQGIDDDLQHLIFNQLDRRVKKPEDLLNVELCNKVLNYRGDCVLDEMKCLDELKWSTVDVDFDESILLWHIATQICYHDDMQRLSVVDYSKISRCLSEYMLYLIVMYPKMMPKGIGYIRYKKACEELICFFKEKKDIQIEKACQELLQSGSEDLQGNSIIEKLEDARSKSSILSKGCMLAKQLQNLKPLNQAQWECKEKWETITEVWVELLTYAAIHCGWKEHGRQLAKGGQLLTHVCLLLAHFGISPQFQDRSFYHIQVPKKEYFKFFKKIIFGPSR